MPQSVQHILDLLRRERDDYDKDIPAARLEKLMNAVIAMEVAYEFMEEKDWTCVMATLASYNVAPSTLKSCFPRRDPRAYEVALHFADFAKHAREQIAHAGRKDGAE